MPKAKPDQVIVHRIEFQQAERDMLTGLTAALSFNKVADPVVKLLNDVTGTITVLTLLALSGLMAGVTWVFIFDPFGLKGPLEQFADQWGDEKQNALLAGTLVSGNPIAAIIDLVELVTGTNIPDFGAGYEPGDLSGSGGGSWWQSDLGGQSFNDPNVFLSDAWWEASQATPNPYATTPDWNVGVPTGPVQESGEF
jgi:hypothetical protein